MVSRFHDHTFNAMCDRSLVYNTCWEDPAVDRRALALNSDDTVLVITSAGCNVLDYALVAPKRIYAVDTNPPQTALLELKVAGIRRLAFDDFFAVFGRGKHPEFRALYNDLLRHELSEFSRTYWDRNGAWFEGPQKRDSFYFHGLSGLAARAFHTYLNVRPRLQAGIEALLASTTLEEQRDNYDHKVQPLLWSPQINWVLSRQLTMNMFGVPHTQRKEVENQHEGGVAAFIRDAMGYVFRRIPISTNYFWQSPLSFRSRC